jgi:hypothetical protein
MNRTLSALAPAALSAAFSAAFLAGCAVSATPRYDARFGDAVREAKARMTLNPATASAEPVTGVDGLAARETQKRYQDSFKSPPAVVPVINIGGQINSGSEAR